MNKYITPLTENEVLAWQNPANRLIFAGNPRNVVLCFGKVCGNLSGLYSGAAVLSLLQGNPSNLKRREGETPNRIDSTHTLPLEPKSSDKCG